MPTTSLATRVAARFVLAAYFEPGAIVLYGKYKNHVGKIVAFGKDQWGNPTVEIEPIPKGRKQNKVMGLFKIWRKDVKDKALAERAQQEAAAAGSVPAAPSAAGGTVTVTRAMFATTPSMMMLDEDDDDDA